MRSRVSCELTTIHTLLAAAIVVTQELIVEGTRHRRLVIAVGTGSTKTHARSDNVTVFSGREYSRGGRATVDPWERQRPCRLLFLGVTKKPAKRGREDVC